MLFAGFEAGEGLSGDEWRAFLSRRSPSGRELLRIGDECAVRHHLEPDLDELLGGVAFRRRGRHQDAERLLFDKPHLRVLREEELLLARQIRVDVDDERHLGRLVRLLLAHQPGLVVQGREIGDSRQCTDHHLLPAGDPSANGHSLLRSLARVKTLELDRSAPELPLLIGVDHVDVDGAGIRSLLADIRGNQANVEPPLELAVGVDVQPEVFFLTVGSIPGEHLLHWVGSTGAGQNVAVLS